MIVSCIFFSLLVMFLLKHTKIICNHNINV
nr:MAG TPA: hypothetical protein [Caudoviricetes sp.]